MSAGPASLAGWLAAELAAVEGRLQGRGPTCQLDRRRASPPSLKALEGRYFILRRAARLLERGRPLDALATEGDKARAFLQPGSERARDPQWAAYFEGVLGALADLEQAGGARPGAPQPSSTHRG